MGEGEANSFAIAEVYEDSIIVEGFGAEQNNKNRLEWPAEIVL